VEVDAIAGHAGSLESKIISTHEHVDGTVSGGLALAPEAENARRLGHGLYQEDARKHGITWEVTVKKRLVDAQILVGNDGLTGDKFYNPVDEKKWVSVR